MKSDLSKLNKDQKDQVLRQWKEHQHDTHETDIALSGHGEILKKFSIHKGVWNPNIVSARYHASYLYYNNVRLYENKIAMDMGTGTGLMGVVMGLGGSKKVILTDISLPAVANADENIKKYKLESKSSVLQGDLFENVKEKVDFIVFNQPYFGDVPPDGDSIAASMLDSGDLIKRFLEQAPKFLNKGGIIMMPFYSKAGETNNPVIQGLKYGFNVVTTFKSISGSGLQTGEITIHELTLQN